MNTATLPEAPTALRTAREIADEATRELTTAQHSRAEQLVEDGVCASYSDACLFVAGEAVLDRGGTLSPERAQYVESTREIIAGIEKLHAKREEQERWHRTLRGLNENAARAERVYEWEAGRVYCQTEKEFVASYLEHVAGNERAPRDLAFRFVQNFQTDRELARILRDEVLPILRRRADEAKAAVKKFAATTPPQ